VIATNSIIANNIQDMYNWSGLNSIVILNGANIVEQYVPLGIFIVRPAQPKRPDAGAADQ